MKVTLGNEGAGNVHKSSPAVLKRNDDIHYQSTQLNYFEVRTTASF